MASATQCDRCRCVLLHLGLDQVTNGT
ncbi:MAG: hypothetical protein RLY58_1683, partial [Pseudomonadota bacterium]